MPPVGGLALLSCGAGTALGCLVERHQNLVKDLKVAELEEENERFSARLRALQEKVEQHSSGSSSTAATTCVPAELRLLELERENSEYAYRVFFLNEKLRGLESRSGTKGAPSRTNTSDTLPSGNAEPDTAQAELMKKIREDATKQVADLQERCNELEGKIELQDSILSAVQNEASATESRLHRAIREHVNEKDEQTEKIAELQALVADLRAQADCAETQMGSESQQLEDLEDTSPMSPKSAATLDQDCLRMELDATREEADALRAQNDVLLLKSKADEDGNSEISALKSELARLQAQNEVLEADKASVSQECEVVAAMSKAKDETISALKSEMERMQAQTPIFETEKTIALEEDTVNPEVFELRAENEKLKKELQALKEKPSTSAKKAVDVQSKSSEDIAPPVVATPVVGQQHRSVPSFMPLRRTLPPRLSNAGSVSVGTSQPSPSASYVISSAPKQVVVHRAVSAASAVSPSSAAPRPTHMSRKLSAQPRPSVTAQSRTPLASTPQPIQSSSAYRCATSTSVKLNASVSRSNGSNRMSQTLTNVDKSRTNTGMAPAAH